MPRNDATTYQRINVSLPEDTVRLLDRVTKKGDRSRFIDALVKHYVKTERRRKLEEDLAQGYARWAARDRLLAEEWLPLDEEAWHDTLEKR